MFSFEKALQFAVDSATRLSSQMGDPVAREPPTFVQGAGTPLHLWDPRMRLVDLTGHGDWLTLRDMYTGLSALGAAGSGKTSALSSIALLLMELQCGFVWLCAKPDEVHLVRKIAAHAGRSDDVVVIGEDVDGTISPHRFNPLEYEAGISTTGTGSVVQYLNECAKVLSRKEGERSAAEGERFWNDQFERLLRYCIDTAKLAGLTLSMHLLRQIQLSAPTSREQLADDDWVAQSVCSRCIVEAEDRLNKGEIAEADFLRILTFWTKDYLQLDVKPRSTIDVMMAVLVDAFYAEEPIRTILTTSTTITPEEVIDHGKIVVLSLPTNIYHSAGRMAQYCFKASYQRAMLRRRKPADGSPLRPSVLWVDEAHAFAHLTDAQYFAEVRSNRGINVYLEQGIGGYMRALGLQSPDEVDGYLQNIATKFFFQNNSPQTNLFAADVIGKQMITHDTSNWGHSTGGGHVGDSSTTVERHQVIAGDFGFLRRGGGEEKIVEGIVMMPGHIFSTTGSNHAVCRFLQTELTQ